METSTLRGMVAEKAAKYAFRFEGDRAEIEASLRREKCWKRKRKVKLAVLLDEMGLTVEQLMTDDFRVSWDHFDIEKPGYVLTGDCITRHFMHDDFEDGLDCGVMTTPDDSEVVAYFWHSD